VCIVREKHPLRGRTLSVLGHRHRQETLYLILALPDGGTSLIPAAWTDVGSSLAVVTTEKCRRPMLASAAELIHTRTVADALLRRLDPNHQSPAAEEALNAAGASALNPAVADQITGLGTSESGPASKTHRGSRTSDDECCPPEAEEESP
jgi:hypothetical protein